jgi:murein DD-endopeptidase MepM/ murein hydrolase activator NlpD
MWKTASAIIICVSATALIVGGAAAGDYPLGNLQPGPGYGSVRTELTILSAALSPRSLRGEDFASAVARSLVRKARLSGIPSREVLASALPGPEAVLAMLALDRDVDDFIESSGLAGATGVHYRREVELAGIFRPLRSAYEAAYGSAARELREDSAQGADQGGGGSRKARNRPLAAFPRKSFQRPSVPDIGFAHPYALDLFFESFVQRADGQEGPLIPSISGGLVVASAADWRGGAGPKAWKGGGLSPAAGNGVVVYDPETRRYYSYFHMRSLSVACGDLVVAGQSLGLGGNTGMNARRPDHGGHVHLEIFDAARNRALGALEILDIIDI